MASPTERDLIPLLTSPKETLTVEHKGWLDFTDNAHKAILAKAAIALANEGGGIIVLGTSEDTAQGRKLGSFPRPSNIARYSVDAINGAITKFAVPPFHCEVAFIEHPVTNVEHAFVIVPGGMTVPVMSCRGSDGEIQNHRCYVRKPGPKSEEPYTAEEWGRLFERCLQAGRETMLDAIRRIVQGHGESVAVPTSAMTRLANFISSSRTRWESLIDTTPSDDVSRMLHGHYEVAFSILGIEQPPALTELLKFIDRASVIHHTGWPPFLYLQRPPYSPRPIDGAIETWLGNPNDDQRFFRNPSGSDFWRARPLGDFFMLRGYDEDSSINSEPGCVFNVSLPILRVGEVLLFASRLSRLFGSNLEILVTCQYRGLKNRRLVNKNPRSHAFDGYTCADDVAVLETQTTADQIDDNLVEVLLPLLRPLYERFSFYELDPKLVAREVEELRNSRY